MNTPNKLTILRIVMIPVFIAILMNGHYFLSAAVFIVASLTDALDGHLARKHNLITNFGKIMDPLADKLLVTAALLCLVELGDLAGWMAFLILAREFTITGLRAVAASDGIVIAAGKSGKWKTTFQMLAIIAYLFQNQPFAAWGIPAAPILMWIAVVLTIYSGAEYIYQNRSVFSQ